jgi:hypothetical protein
MPSRKIEQQLEFLNSLRHCGASDQVILQLRKALNDRVNVVIAKAARIAADLELKDLLPDLIAVFNRLFEHATESDPKCWGKEAIAKALTRLGCDESAAFLRGLRHVQMEPVWGTEVDTAATLRGTCALALLQCSDLTREDKLWHEMRTFTDKEASVRADAARALGELDGIEAAFLLRIKARMGDREPSVIGQALESLLQVEGNEAVPFVAEFLTGTDDEVRDEAALALGGSRLPEAVAALIHSWEHSRVRHSGEPLLRALGASRQEPAIEFLIGLIRSGEQHEALAALRALEVQRDSAEIRRKVAEAAGSRQQPSIGEYFRQHFPE